MIKALLWNQDDTFSGREWEAIRRHAQRLARKSAGNVCLLEDRPSPEGFLSLNGKPGMRGEPFKFSQLNEGAGFYECKVLGYPYGDVARSILHFAAAVSPQKMTVSFEPDGLAEANSDFVWALNKAREVLRKDRLTSEEILFNRVMEAEVASNQEAVSDACRQASWEVVRAVYGGKATVESAATADRASWTPQEARRALQRCGQMALETFGQTPFEDVNTVVTRLARIFPQPGMDVRGVVEMACQEKVEPLAHSMVLEIRRELGGIATLRNELSSAMMGDLEGPTAAISTALGRSIEEWETACLLSMDALDGTPDYLIQACQAAEGDATSRALYGTAHEKSNHLRSTAPKVLGSYLRWRDAVDKFMSNVSMMVDPCVNAEAQRLETMLTGQEREPHPAADAPDVLGAVTAMNECGQVLGSLRGTEREALARTHYDLLVAVQSLGCQDVLGGDLCRDLIAQINKTGPEEAGEVQQRILGALSAATTENEGAAPVEQLPARAGRRGRR